VAKEKKMILSRTSFKVKVLNASSQFWFGKGKGKAAVFSMMTFACRSTCYLFL
jgi:hypothetical protein